MPDLDNTLKIKKKKKNTSPFPQGLFHGKQENRNGKRGNRPLNNRIHAINRIHIMKKVRITVIRKTCHRDLMEKYENPIEHACSLQEEQVFIANGWEKPEGLCESAWQSMSAFVMALSHGASHLYGNWMKNPESAMISCNDGFRPVSFLIEALPEEP